MTKKLTIPEKMRREHIKKMEGKERKTLEKFVQIDKGKILGVNWDALAKFKGTLDYGSYAIFEGVNDDIINYLRAKGFLKYSCEEGSFLILGFMGVNGGPRHSAASYHGFSKLKDAQAYLPFAEVFGEGAGKPYKVVGPVR